MGHFILISCNLIGGITMLLALIVLLSPVVINPTNLALSTISPGRLNGLTNNTKGTIDGPTIRMGLLGSCTQYNSTLNCTTPSFSPKYDFTSIPNYSPRAHAPTSTAPAWILMGLIMYIMFLVMFTMWKLHEEHPKTIPQVFGKQGVIRANGYWGLLSWLILLSAFGVNYGVFVNSVNNFNSQSGQGGPALQANTSNGFVVVWFVLGFSSIPLLVIFEQIHAAYRARYKRNIVRGKAALERMGQEEQVPSTEEFPMDYWETDERFWKRGVDLGAWRYKNSNYDRVKKSMTGKGMCVVQ